MNKHNQTRLTIAALTIFGATVATFAQTTQDAAGNYHEAAPTGTHRTTADHDSLTTVTYTDLSGTVQPVYRGIRGGRYLATTNAAGEYRRKYLKLTKTPVEPVVEK